MCVIVFIIGCAAIRVYDVGGHADGVTGIGEAGECTGRCAGGNKPRKLPIASPDLNSVAERFVLSIKGDCLDELMFFSEKQLRRAINQYLDFYHKERPHQGVDIGNNILFPDERADKNRTGKVIKSSRLGGLLNFYYREDAA